MYTLTHDTGPSLKEKRKRKFVKEKKKEKHLPLKRNHFILAYIIPLHVPEEELTTKKERRKKETSNLSYPIL
jgi:beta-galactosidase beta subunit